LSIKKLDRKISVAYSQVMGSLISKYDDDDLVTVAEAARCVGVAPKTMSRYRLDGRVPYTRYSSRKYLYKIGDLKKFRDEHYHEASDYEL
jgi:hypothetical protein